MAKIVFETTDHIVMHGIGKNNPTVYRTEKGEAYIYLGDEVFYPLYMQGKHVNVTDAPDGGGYHYRNSSDALHLGPRERNIKVSLISWKEKQELIPADERIAQLQQDVDKCVEAMNTLRQRVATLEKKHDHFPESLEEDNENNEESERTE